MKNFMKNFPKDRILKSLIAECSEVIQSDYDELKKENTELKRKLNKIKCYSHHTFSCDRNDGRSPCSCGLSDLIKDM